MVDTTEGIDPRDLRISAITPLDELGLHLKVDDCDEQGCRQVVVIDPNDDAQVQAVIDTARRFSGPGDATAVQRWQQALRELANPKTYREHALPSAPWPQISECHSRHVAGHECPQCAWEHEHDWVAWTYDLGRAFGGQTPIRCSKCGGRKCDLDRCPQRRHTHTHDGSGS